YLTVSEPDVDGIREVFYELNGQPRSARIADKSSAAAVETREQADPNDPSHVAAPMPGKIGSIDVKTGQKVAKGETLLRIEAMKMETAVYAPCNGKVQRITVKAGSTVAGGD